MDVIVAIDRAVRAVCPIHGVSIPDPQNKSTWVIHFKGQATVLERSNAQAVVDAADVQAIRQREENLDSAISGDSTVAALRAMTPQEFDDWWTANVTTAAQAIQVLKRISRIVIRRVL